MKPPRKSILWGAVLLCLLAGRCAFVSPDFCVFGDVSCNPLSVGLYVENLRALAEASSAAAAAAGPPPGTLDTTFGNGQGYTVRDLSGAGYTSEGGVAIALNTSTGAYILTGNATQGGFSRMVVFSFLNTGATDTAFGGGNGYVDISPCVQNHYNTSNGVSLRTDGKIGVFGSVDFCASGFETSIARLNADGTFDTSFGGTCTPGCAGNASGRFRFDVGGNNMGGKLVNNADNTAFLLTTGDVGGNPMDFVVLKVTNTGVLDTTWGGGTGRFTRDNISGGSGDDRSLSGALDASGNIWLGGYSFNGANNDVGIIRVNAAGTALDTNWNGTGILSLDAVAGSSTGDAGPSAMIVDSSDRLLVAITAGNGTDNDAVIFRYNWNGTLDTTFATSGKLLINNGGADAVYDIQLDSQGRLLVVGASTFSGNQDAVLWRYTSAGVLDTTFGTNGLFRVGHATGVDFFGGMTLDSQNRITLVGQLWNGVDGDQAIWRLYN